MSQLENNEVGVRLVIVGFAALFGVMVFGARAVAEETGPDHRAGPEKGMDPEKIIEFLLFHHYEIKAVLPTVDPDVFRILFQYETELVICQITHEPRHDEWKDGHQCTQIH